MMWRLLANPICAGLFVLTMFQCGCQSTSRNATHIELLHNELRQLEDLLYEQESDLDSKDQDLEAAKREIELLKKEIDQLGKQRAPEPPTPKAPPADSSHRDPPRAPLPILPNLLEKPDVNIPPPAAPTIPELNEPMPPVPGGEAPKFQPSSSAIQQSPYRPAQYTETVSPTPATPAVTANSQWGPAAVGAPASVDHLAIHPRLTGGLASDKKPGDDGVMLVFVPRNALDQPLEVRGAIAVALVDPKLQARTARWEFSAQESLKFFKNSMLAGDAFHLDLRWPAQVPEHAEQELHLRFTTVDGREHTAQHQLILDLPGPKVAQTPRTQPASLPVPQTNANNDDPAPRWNGTAETTKETRTSPMTPSSASLITTPNSPTMPGDKIDINIPEPDTVAPNNRRDSLGSRLLSRRSPRASASGVSGNTAPIEPPLIEIPGLGTNSGANTSMGDVRSPWNWRSWFLPDATPAPAAQTGLPPLRADRFTIVPDPNAQGVRPTPGTPLPIPTGPLSGNSGMARDKPEWRPYR